MTSLLVTDGTVATEESKIKVRLYSVRTCSICKILFKFHEKDQKKTESDFFFKISLTAQKLLKTQCAGFCFGVLPKLI